MIRVIGLLFISLFIFSKLLAEEIKFIEIKGNDRISSETIKIFSNIELGQNIDDNGLNEILKNLYSTEFFNDINVKLNNGTLVITVSENSLVQNVIINGVKNKDLIKAIFEQLAVKEKNSYVDQKVINDSEKISNFLKFQVIIFLKLMYLLKIILIILLI